MAQWVLGAGRSECVGNKALKGWGAIARDNWSYGKEDRVPVPEFKEEEGMRAYRRKVAVYRKLTTTPAHKQAIHLIDRITEPAAVEHVEVLMEEDFKAVSCRDGVEVLLAHLTKKYEPLEIHRKGKLIDEFLYECRRAPNEEVRDFISRFETAERRARPCMGGELPNEFKAHIFLKQLAISSDKESQLVSAGGGIYDYETLRNSALAVIPRAAALRGPQQQHPGGVPSGFHNARGRSRTYLQEGEDEDGEEPPTLAVDEDHEASDLEEEAAVMLSQAKTKRAEVEKGRSCVKGSGTPEGRKSPRSRGDIQALKDKHPCAICKRTGHWARECPDNPDNIGTTHLTQNDKSKVPDEGDGAEVPVTLSAIFAVTEQGTDLFILVDTACARSVAGRKWYDAYRTELKRRYDIEPTVVKERHAFRFGPHGKLYSAFAVMVVVEMEKRSRHPRGAREHYRRILAVSLVEERHACTRLHHRFAQPEHNVHEVGKRGLDEAYRGRRRGHARGDPGGPLPCGVSGL